MKRFIQLISFAMILCAFSACHKHEDLSEDEIYAILNEIIADDSLSIMVVDPVFTSLKWSSEYEKYFSLEDRKFSSEQDKKFAKMKIANGKLKIGWKPAMKNPYYIRVDSTVSIVEHLSFPVISIDRETVLMEVYTDCKHCMLGSGDNIYLFKKEKGHWRKQWLSGWIS